MQINDILNDNKIIGVVGNSGSGKSSFVSKFEESKKIGIINFDSIKCSVVNEQLEYYIKKYKFKLSEIDDRKNEIMKMLELDQNILNRNIYELSESEFAKVLISSVLLYNPEVIIVDELIDSLDYKSKVKLFKLFIKLKKFFNKKIIVVTSNIDDIYEFIDDVIIIDEGKILAYDDKYSAYKNYEFIDSKNIRIPIIVSFIYKMKEHGIMLDNVDTVNELIKTIYREMR